MAKTLCVVLAAAFGVAGSALVAAPGQTYPGQATQGRVLVENRGPQQSVPVSIQQIAGDASMRVQILGTPSVSVNGLLETRRTRQNWEYMRLTAQPDQDITTELNRLGAAGWETSLQLISQATTLVVVLKRPRP
jgi:hypothetical protein